MVRSLIPGYCQCNMEIGKMFLNFLLHEELQQLLGVDVTHICSNDPENSDWGSRRRGRWERWSQNWMGLTDSPYRSIQWTIQLKMEAYGDKANQSNPFHWEHVVFNLPGKDNYRPDLPWMMKIFWDGHLSTDVIFHVDDRRATGFIERFAGPQHNR